MTDPTPDNTQPKPPELKADEKPAEEAKPAADAAAKPEEKPAADAAKPAADAAKPAPEGAKAAPAAPTAGAPAGAKAAPAAAPAGAKAAAPAGGPAAAKAPPAPPAPKEPLKPGVFGSFLADHGISSERLDDHFGGVECIVVAPEHVQKALKLLRHSEETKLNYLLTVSGVEQKESFESVYHLWSYSSLNELVVKVQIKKAEVPEGQLPMVPSLSRFWKAANWHERETYDLMGIRYLGHPYPRRILNTWDWDGHPLRRDYLQPIDALNDKAPGSFR